MSVLDWLTKAVELVGHVVTLRVDSCPPVSMTYPKAWLDALEPPSIPLTAYITLENFGHRRLEHIEVEFGPAAPDYAIETKGITVGAWSCDLVNRRLEIARLDPGQRATFYFFHDHEPERGFEPKVMIAGKLLGSASRWLGHMTLVPRLLLVTVAASIVLAFGILGYIAFDVFGRDGRMQRENYERYRRAAGLVACEPKTLRAEDGTVNAAEVAQHLTGVDGALVFNTAKSLDELLRRQQVFICVRLP